MITTLIPISKVDSLHINIATSSAVFLKYVKCIQLSTHLVRDQIYIVIYKYCTG